MKYQVGDTVLLLHSQEEGEVVEILNDEMMLIDVAGVQFPVYNDQVDFPYFKRFSEKKVVVAKKEKKYLDNLKIDKEKQKYKVVPGVWLSFLPVFDKDVFDDDVVEKFKIYLINQTDDSLEFAYQIMFKGAPDFHLNNTILPVSDFYLHDIPFEDLNDSPKFEFDFSLTMPDKRRTERLEANFKIRAKQLFQKIEEMKLKNEPTFSFMLFEKYPDKIEEVIPDYTNTHGRLYNISQAKGKLESPRSVVDLHIEKLTDNWKGLSNFEILTIQLTYFEKFYNLAVAHQQ
ncbi:MAG: hypothetical protein ABI325_14015, partial [Ginsengibacter sp.]